jgi:adenylate kinase
MENNIYPINKLRKMIICISGTPGTGKTTLAKRLSKDMNVIMLNGNDIIKRYGLSEGYDKKRDCIIVSHKKFSDSVLKECKDSKKIYIIDSHLSHHIPPKKVAICIICKTPLKELEKRLQKRKYDSAKIRENLDAEIMEVCLTEAKDKGHNILIFNNRYPTLKKEIIKYIGFENNKKIAYLDN